MLNEALVTKTRLLCFQAFSTIIIVGLSLLVFFILERIADIFASVIVLFLLFLFIYANYKIFKIAQSKRGDKRVAPATGTSMDENRKTRILNLKSISTLYLAVAVFSVVCARSLYIQVYI